MVTFTVEILNRKFSTAQYITLKLSLKKKKKFILYFPQNSSFNLIINHRDCLTSFTLRKKCPHSEFFWSVISRIRAE